MNLPTGGAAPWPVDAVMLCGDRGASKAVDGESKAFLPLHGKPLFIHVVEALLNVTRVGRVFIIGDRARLDHCLAQWNANPGRPIVTLPQGASLIENVWNGFLATIEGYQPGLERRDEAVADKTVFFLPGDSPIISSAEIDEFFDQADMARYDYVAGFTPQRAMEKFYPAGGAPGIRMAYLYFAEGVYRINNLHLARPFAGRNRDAIQRMYNSRYQKDLGNIVRLTRDMWRHHVKLQSLALYFMLQLSQFFAFTGLWRLNRFTRRHTPMEAVAAAAGRILGLRMGWAITTRGGAALDIDNARDYAAMKERFFEWKESQQAAPAPALRF